MTMERKENSRIDRREINRSRVERFDAWAAPLSLFGTSRTRNSRRLHLLALITVLLALIGFAPKPSAIGQTVEVAKDARSAKQYWLITRDGQRIAASEAWEMRGKRLVYRNLAGDLVSIRVSEIDLDASELASNPPPAITSTPAPPPQPVLVLRSNEQPELAAQPSDRSEPGTGSGTSANGANVGETLTADSGIEPASGGSDPALDAQANDAASAATAETGRAGAAAKQRSKGSVKVTSWRNLSSEQDSATIYGTLENAGPRNASGISIVVVVLDEVGGEVQRRPANPLSSKLGPGETTNFRAILENLGPHTDFRFEVTSTP